MPSQNNPNSKIIRRIKRALARAEWLVSTFVFSRLGALYLWFSGAAVGRNLTLRSFPICRCYGSGQIRIGSDVTILNKLRENTAGIMHRTVLIAGDGSKLSIGNGVGISGAIIDARAPITIGNSCMLGANCSIFSTDYHSVYADLRLDPAQAVKSPVVLEDHVWVGAHAIILKGVTIGARSVIAAGSVVTKSIPPDVIAGGNPARVLKKLQNGDKASNETTHI
jgi:acetyltransferase-like isoleucine patch superfamily enzyme